MEKKNPRFANDADRAFYNKKKNTLSEILTESWRVLTPGGHLIFGLRDVRPDIVPILRTMIRNPWTISVRNRNTVPLLLAQFVDENADNELDTWSDKYAIKPEDEDIYDVYVVFTKPTSGRKKGRQTRRRQRQTARKI